MSMPVLRGGKVALRPFGPVDVSDNYIGWLNDPAVVRFSNQRFRRHDRASCLRYLASFEGSGNLFLGIRRMADDRPIGTMTAYLAEPHGTADIGILLGDTATWGKGYGQDAWNTLLAWLLGERSLRKVTAGALACNRGMVAVMERSGMHLEGARRAQEIVEGRAEDVLYYARFRGA